MMAFKESLIYFFSSLVVLFANVAIEEWGFSCCQLALALWHRLGVCISCQNLGYFSKNYLKIFLKRLFTYNVVHGLSYDSHFYFIFSFFQAELYRVNKEFDKAEPLYLEAINILEEAFGHDDVRYASIFMKTGDLELSFFLKLKLYFLAIVLKLKLLITILDIFSSYSWVNLLAQ